ncbi:hypothetical protein JW905_15420, partial [bacterium]|nr:hypothetical protein [candidate division CSSED10-310 bacterium]
GSWGNGNGCAEPTETIEWLLELRNVGSTTLAAPEVEIVTVDPCLTVVNGLCSWPDLIPGETALSSDALVVTLGGCEIGGAVGCVVNLSAGGAVLGQFQLSLPVDGPDFSLGGYWTEPTAAPGALIDLGLLVENHGGVTAEDVEVTVTSLDFYLGMSTTVVEYPDIPPGAARSGETRFSLEISPACPAQHTAVMDVLCNAHGRAQTLRFNLVIGPHGFSDDVESGGSLWVHGGFDDLWHRTTARSSSGSCSWYCGLAPEQQYIDNANDFLDTVPFLLAPNSTLTLQRWFRFQNYGVDGCYVLLFDGNEYHTLDFIGSGGALGLLPIQSGWYELQYDLAEFSGVVQLRFLFQTDEEDVEEGIYIDDVRVRGDGPMPGPLQEVPATGGLGVFACLAVLSVLLKMRVRRYRR